MLNIVGVKHDSNGEIISYKLDNNTTISKQEGIEMAQLGQIDNVIIGNSKDGEKFLRSTPDGKRSNNLDNLPEIK